MKEKEGRRKEERRSSYGKKEGEGGKITMKGKRKSD